MVATLTDIRERLDTLGDPAYPEGAAHVPASSKDVAALREIVGDLITYVEEGQR